MQVWSKGFFFMVGCSLALALFIMHVLLTYKEVKPDQRKLYLFSFSIVWTLFQVVVFQ